MPPSIDRVVNKNSEFFIAICKSDFHSYVAVGVKQDNGEQLLLGSFGKALRVADDVGSCTLSKSLCSTLFSQSDAYIQNEKIIRYEDDERSRMPGTRMVRYKAYGISYQHYIQFLNHMAALSREQEKDLASSEIKPHHYKLKAFTPVSEDETTVRLEWNNLNDERELNAEVCPGEYKLAAFGNTCRHSAIRLVDAARQTDGLGEGVSTVFFREPPLEAVFRKGVVGTEHHFYILPLPPTAFSEITGKKQAFLIEIYERLDRMMLIAQDDPHSIEKFEELKKLYLEIAGKAPDSIEAVISSINSWEEEHKRLIDTHRGWHFFSSTATRKMFNKFHERFAQIRQDCQSEVPTIYFFEDNCSKSAMYGQKL